MTGPSPARLFCLALLACALPPRGLRAADEQPTYMVTTDTLAYCDRLQHDVEQQHSQLAEIQHLLSEGRDMCARGQIRGGIQRLRRALVVLHHRGSTPAQ